MQKQLETSPSYSSISTTEPKKDAFHSGKVDGTIHTLKKKGFSMSSCTDNNYGRWRSRCKNRILLKLS